MSWPFRRERTRRQLRELRARPGAPPPEGLAERLKRAIPEDLFPAAPVSGQDEPAPGTRTGRPRTNPQVWALAASLLAVVGCALVIWQLGQRPESRTMEQPDRDLAARAPGAPEEFGEAARSNDQRGEVPHRPAPGAPTAAVTGAGGAIEEAVARQATPALAAAGEAGARDVQRSLEPAAAERERKLDRAAPEADLFAIVPAPPEQEKLEPRQAALADEVAPADEPAKSEAQPAEPREQLASAQLSEEAVKTRSDVAAAPRAELPVAPAAAPPSARSTVTAADAVAETRVAGRLETERRAPARLQVEKLEVLAEEPRIRIAGRIVPPFPARSALALKAGARRVTPDPRTGRFELRVATAELAACPSVVVRLLDGDAELERVTLDAPIVCPR